MRDVRGRGKIRDGDVCFVVGISTSYTGVLVVDVSGPEDLLGRREKHTQDAADLTPPPPQSRVYCFVEATRRSSYVSPHIHKGRPSVQVESGRGGGEGGPPCTLV